MNQPNSQNPKQGMQDNKQKNPSSGQTGQQTKEGNRPGQGGYSSPGQGNQGGQSAPADKS